MDSQEKVKILLVDDDPKNLTALEAALGAPEYHLITARSGEQALRCLLTEEDFAVILLDVQMPGLDGFETAEAIKQRERSRHIPIIFLTAFGRESQQIFRGYSIGAVDYQFKPFEPAILRMKVAAFVELYRKTKQLQRLKETLEQQVEERTAALRESEERFRLFMQNLPGVAFLKDLEGRLVYANAYWETAFHRKLSEVAGKGTDELWPPDVAARLRAGDRQVIEGRLALQTIETIPQDHGPQHWLTVKFPIPDPQGNAALVGGIAIDISERKQAEERLQRQLVRMNLLDGIIRAIAERQDVESIVRVVIRNLESDLPADHGCMWVLDAQHDTLTVLASGVTTRAIAEKLGLREGTVIPVGEAGLRELTKGRIVYVPDTAQSLTQFLGRFAEAGIRSLVIAPLFTEGRVSGLLCVSRREADGFSSGECEFLRALADHLGLAVHQAQLHTDLQRAYDELRRTQQAMMQEERLRALGQMASGIAHDINNALSPAALYTESLLETEPALSTRAREYLTTISRALEDVAHTVARMREFYRARGPEVAQLPVQLNQVAQQVVDLTRAKWRDMPQRRGVVINVQTSLQDDLPLILGTEAEIREALTNLIINAVDAMPQGGSLRIRTYCLLPSVVLEVADTGIGMDEEARAHCLEPFFTTKGERGTGLGLAMVYGVIQRHFGAIEIESAIGHGTTVRLVFPPRAEGADGARPPAEAKPSERLRILIVDDDPLLRKSLKDTLETDGHTIIVADGGQVGIETFRATREAGAAPHVVITDLGMPHVDGREVARAVKEASPETPVLLLTGWGARLKAEGEIPANVDRVLAKPPKLRELREAMADVRRKT